MAKDATATATATASTKTPAPTPTDPGAALSPVRFLFGLSKDHDAIQTFIKSLVGDVEPVTKTYGKATYLNYKDVGLSFLFEPNFCSVDLYSGSTSFKACPPNILKRILPRIKPDATGKDLVAALGEPDRKGGGGAIEIWTEWATKGLMVQFATKKWDDGAEARWSVLTVFK